MLPIETYRLTEASRAWRPDGKMQLRENRRETAQPQSRDAPRLPAYSHPLPERTTLDTTCLYIMCLDLATEQLPQNVAPTGDNRKPHGTSHTGDPGDKRTQAAGRPYALSHPQSDRRKTSSSALTAEPANGRDGTNRKRKRDSGERPEDGGTARDTPCPTLTGKLHPSPKTANPTECTQKTVSPQGLITPSHVCLC